MVIKYFVHDAVASVIKHDLYGKCIFPMDINLNNVSSSKQYIFPRCIVLYIVNTESMHKPAYF